MDEPAGQDHRPALGRHLVLPGRYLVTLSSSVGSYLDGVWAGPEPEASQLGRCGGVSPGEGWQQITQDSYLLFYTWCC